MVSRHSIASRSAKTATAHCAGPKSKERNWSLTAKTASPADDRKTSLFEAAACGKTQDEQLNCAAKKYAAFQE